MTTEILELLYFYRSSIGKTVYDILLQHIQYLWDTPPPRLCGIGYTDIFLDHFHDKSSYCLSLTPSYFGAYARSGIETYQTAIIDDLHIPLMDESQKNILCMHILEHTHYPERFLKSVYQILMPEGEVIFIVPNRRSAWASNENTPFGSGRPYTRKQITNLIQNAGFIISDFIPALFISPQASKFTLYNREFMESAGKLFFSRYSGIHIVRAVKRVYIPPVQLLKHSSQQMFHDMMPKSATFETL